MSVHPEPLTLAEFIAWETRQPERHEFRDGAVYAMAGASDDHNAIVANLIAMVRPALRGGACRIFANDMMLLTEFPGARYPDILVTCDGRDAQDRRAKRHPKLIIEVLSETTAGIDAGAKLDEYQTIEELQEYVLIDSRKPWIRIYRRNADKLETALPITIGAIELRSLALMLTLESIYEDVSWFPVAGPRLER
jgi:Uma2 family endonuclease